MMGQKKHLGMIAMAFLLGSVFSTPSQAGLTAQEQQDVSFAQDSSHPNSWEILKKLWTTASPNQAEFRKMLAPTLRKIVDENLPHRVEAARLLMEAGNISGSASGSGAPAAAAEGASASQPRVRSALPPLKKKPEPASGSAGASGFNPLLSPSEMGIKDTLANRELLKRYAQNPDDWEAIKKLWFGTELEDREGLNTLMVPQLYKIAEERGAHWFEAVQFLWWGFGEEEMQYRARLASLLEKLATDDRSPHQWDAIFCLWEARPYEGGEERDGYRQKLFPTIERLVNHPGPLQWRLIELVNRTLLTMGNYPTKRALLLPALRTLALGSGLYSTEAFQYLKELDPNEADRVLAQRVLAEQKARIINPSGRDMG